VEAKLTPEELDWLGQLDTDAPVKPELPAPIGDKLVQHGLAISLVEGGLQLTTLGRDYLSKGANARR